MNNKEEKSNLPFFGIPKLFPLIRKYRKEMLMIITTSIIFGLADLTAPILQRYAINHFIGEKTLQGMPLFIVIYALVIIVFGTAGYFNIRFSMKTEITFDTEMRNAAFAHLQKLSFDYYNQNSVGYIHSRVMSDTSRIGEALSWNLGDVVFFILEIIGSIAVMFFFNVKLTLLVLIILPVLAFFYVLFQGKLFRFQKEVRESNSQITGNFNEGIIGAKTIKSLVIEDKIEKDFKAETKNMLDKSLKYARLKSFFTALTTLAASTALAIVLWKGGVIAASETGTFALFMTYARSLMEPVNFLVEDLAQFIAVKVNIDRYSRLMKTKPLVTDTREVIEKYGDCFEPKKENWEEFKGDIELENVDFKYPDGDEMVLNNFSLKIPFGTNVAIVGETGAGKSTLVNLICRFYEPTKGRVLIDGRDARERSQLWLHSSLGYVLQTPHLFTGTVRENLVYGREDATEEEIWNAIDMVSARSVIDKLDKGLDSDVGEGGDLLSTGEKQLISFARAILADPKIIVLDEATASVDTITEQKIQNAIYKVIRGRTSIVIAHRLSTIRNADVILAVSGGKIVEQGKHNELMAKKGYYYKLWTRQFLDEETEKIWEKNK